MMPNMLLDIIFKLIFKLAAAQLPLDCLKKEILLISDMSILVLIASCLETICCKLIHNCCLLYLACYG